MIHLVGQPKAGNGVLVDLLVVRIPVEVDIRQAAGGFNLVPWLVVEGRGKPAASSLVRIRGKENRLLVSVRQAQVKLPCKLTSSGDQEAVGPEALAQKDLRGVEIADPGVQSTDEDVIDRKFIVGLP